MEAQNPIVAKIASIPDVTDRARAAQQFLDNGRDTIKAVERIRDQAIREVRANPGRPTIDQLAQAIGVGRHIIVDATRGKH